MQAVRRTLEENHDNPHEIHMWLMIEKAFVVETWNSKLPVQG